MLYKELIYMIADELKLNSDDSYFTNDHILFLCSKYRALLLHQRYADIKKMVAESNYSTICLELEDAPDNYTDSCCGSKMRRTIDKIPYILKGTTPKIFPNNYFKGINIVFISRERMRYVGYNRWTDNIIYSTLAPDHHIYLKSNNPQYHYLTNIKVTALFEDITETFKLSCDDNGNKCDIMDSRFPIEEGLVPALIELVVKELRNSTYLPEDSNNNADDDLSKVNIKTK